MTIKFFEEADPLHLKDFYLKEVPTASGLIDIDLNFETTQISKEQVEKLNTCLENLQRIIEQSWQWILDDYKKGEDVREYISIHLEDLDENDSENLLKDSDPLLSLEERFLQTLKVNRIGIHPSSPEEYLVIDWMCNPDISNYILVVVVNENLKLEHLTIES